MFIVSVTETKMGFNYETPTISRFIKSLITANSYYPTLY